MCLEQEKIKSTEAYNLINNGTVKYTPWHLGAFLNMNEANLLAESFFSGIYQQHEQLHETETHLPVQVLLSDVNVYPRRH